MPNNWDDAMLGDVANDVTVGHVGPMATEYVDDGVPFLRSLNVKPHAIDLADIKFISCDFHERLRKSALAPGDVVTVRTGKPGATAVIPATLPVANCSDVVIIRPGNRLDPRWLSYYINGIAGGFVASRLVGAVQQHFNVGAAREIRLALPPIREQCGIAATLGALDDKIESNRRAVELIQRLLVLEFQKLLITKPVDYQLLSESTSITKGVSYKSADLQPSRTSLVTLKSFDRNGGYKIDGLKQYVGPYKERQVIEPGEVVVAQTDLTQGAEVIGRAVRVPADSSADVLVGSLDLVIVRPSARITPEYLLGVLVDESFREYCRSRTSGTTVLHLAGDAIPSYLAPIVPAMAQQNFSALSRPLLARADSLNIETVELASLRDALLPELLSGRICVPEAREVVQEAIA